MVEPSILDSAPALPQWVVEKLGERIVSTAEFDWHRALKPRKFEIEPDAFEKALYEDTTDRSRTVGRVIARCIRSGYTAAEVHDVLSGFDRTDETCAVSHYANDEQLRADIARMFSKPNPNDVPMEVRFKVQLDAWAAAHTNATEEQTAAYVETLVQLSPEVIAWAAKYKPVKPSEAMKRSAPGFYDKDRLFLNAKGGSSTIIYAAYSNFKTTFSCASALRIAKEHDVRVLYVVCEGADGFGPLTLQAAVKDWNEHHKGDGITEDWLDAHLVLEEVTPRLDDPASLQGLAAKYRDWAPGIVVIDTLGAASAGLNLSAVEVGTAIGFNFRSFVRDLKTNGWLIHHEGKNAENGALGSIYIANDTDTELNLKHDHLAEVLAVMVEKCRWGERYSIINFGTRKVPGLKIEGWDELGEFVAVYALEAGDPKKLVKVARTKEQAAAKNTAAEQRIKIEEMLREAEVRDPSIGWTSTQVAEPLIDPQAEGESDGQYQTRLQHQVKKINNNASRDPLYRRLFEMVNSEAPPHRKVRRWFLPVEPPHTPQAEAPSW
jgi:hypothetical protein